VKTYSGRRPCGVPLVLVHRDDGARMLGHAAASGSPAEPFDWGRPKTGARLLAAALAADLLQRDPPAGPTVAALERIVEKLPGEWVLRASDLLETIGEVPVPQRAHA
jgi:hypothetical protein